MMEKIRITGGGRLCGKVGIPTAKNSVLPMMAAALLCDDTVTLNNVPLLGDVDTSLDLLNALGAKAVRRKDKIIIEPARRYGGQAPDALFKAMRSSVFYLAPLLLRNKAVILPLPGGCRLGARPIDLHLAGLFAMGARVEEDGRQVICRLDRPLAGCRFCLSFPSVGATETLMMAASLAEGETLLCGCAREPEIEDLAAFLNACGAKIEGAGTGCIRITGQKQLKGCTHTPIPDRIAAATVLCAGAACGGMVTAQGAQAGRMTAVLAALAQMGASIAVNEAGISLYREVPLRPAAFFAAPHPALATDAGPLLAAVMLGAAGESRITDRVFESRFGCSGEFEKLGAQLYVEERTLVIQGGRPLKGAKLTAEDLRGGAAIVLAALCAEGESEVFGTRHIRRGYGDIAAFLSPLGAKIETVGEQEEKTPLISL